jgi:AraC-like DNA-binding protein
MQAGDWPDVLLVPPPPALDAWLSAGIAVRRQPPKPGAGLARFPAGVSSAVVVLAEGRFSLAQGEQVHLLPAAFASGPSTRPVVLSHSGGVRSVGVMVRPAAAAALFGVPERMTDRVIDAAPLFGSSAQALAFAAGAEGPQAALHALFEWVAARAADPQRAALRVQAMALQEASLLGVTEAARRQGCSPRQFERRFAAVFGMAPKRFHRLARAEAAMRIALATRRCDTELALGLGYFDQSHLGRDLRELAGLSPGEIARLLEEDDPSWWPLRVGAAYPEHGVRADFAAGEASLFS